MKFSFIFLFFFVIFFTACKKDNKSIPVNNNKSAIVIADDIPIKNQTKKIALHQAAKKKC